MQIEFYNTLTHAVEPFEPITPGQVKMYNCGPTVYDFAHIGNFKTFLFADVLRRFLELTGHEVHQVMNITDVGHMTDDQALDGGGEDKMQAAARRLKEAKKQGKAPVDDPNDPFQVAEFYTQAFLEDARKLRLKIADEYPQNMPRATQHVEQMLGMIQQLLDAGHAYTAPDGAIYYDIQSFPEYGKLSGNTLDQLRGGAGGRVTDEHQKAKKHPADFLLWKPDSSHLMKWDPKQFGYDFGEGYPGWHIECSAMATALLDQPTIDIHTGGEDNIFPHHECEIAQTCGATGRESFARFWMHSRHLMVEGTKMSKSRGNFFTVRQILEGEFTGRPVDPAALRLAMIRSRYREQLNFSREELESAAKNVQRLRETAAKLEKQADGVTFEVTCDHPQAAKLLQFLADDLNTGGAINGVVLPFAYEMVEPQTPEQAAEALAVLRYFDQVLAVLEPERKQSTGDDALDIETKCKALDDARAAKDYAAADAIRDELQAAGYDVKTTREGTTATKRLA